MATIFEWLGQWYLARARRAELKAAAFKKKSENFFHKLRGRA